MTPWATQKQMNYLNALLSENGKRPYPRGISISSRGAIAQIHIETKAQEAMRFSVVVRRSNGRLLKRVGARSHYAAKLLRRQLEGKYDETYRVDIERGISVDEWKAWLNLVSDPHPIFTGSEADAKHAARTHPRHDVAYVEDPDGNEYEYNENTKEWVTY